MPWHARLNLDYRLQADRTNAHFSHEGPLRILQSLYPEGTGICHNVLVHPPGGLVGGDTLDITVKADAGAHGLITTPGASRFYRSDGEPALQRTRILLARDARLEWLPLEALCYSGCQAHNHLTMDLQPGAQLIGWDVAAFGLPLADQPFVAGSLQQHIEVPGHWLERGRVDAADALLMNGRLGLAGHRCLASLFFVTGSEMPRPQREQLLDLAREVTTGHALESTAGATAPNDRTVMVRVLAPVVEPAMGLLRAIRGAWRQGLWNLPGTLPRIWAL
ncbi:MAG: urease accessory protein UreD [Ramlibacter sp.]|nr:urease accessory protein UreD [Ramlibacter sp.]